MSEPTLADLTERLFKQFDGHIPLPVIVRTVRQAKRQLDIAGEPAPPERVERLARQRLLDHARTKADATADDDDTPDPRG